MMELKEERFDAVYGGAEESIENGSSGSGERIHTGDYVTWNGHEGWGKGHVMGILWGYAFVTFRLCGEVFEKIIELCDLTKAG
ncbi:MAG: hypothetical protein IK139_07120 [Lachnospiraceae bacterium]|nr:hypothetical protein [Lachnospiraceae bacterium]